MKIILTRHGESQGNVDKIYQGDYDSPLTQKGIYQAELLSLRLRNEKFDLIYTSNLQRAYITAESIQKYHPNINLIKDSRLNEKSHGIYSGLKRSHVEKYIYDSTDYWTQKPENGESLLDIISRVEQIFKEILEKKQDVLIVSHQLVLRILRQLLLELPREEALDKQIVPADNTAVFIYQITATGVEKLLENCSKHILEAKNNSSSLNLK